MVLKNLAQQPDNIQTITQESSPLGKLLLLILIVGITLIVLSFFFKKAINDDDDKKDKGDK